MYERQTSLNPLHCLGFMTVRRRFLLTPSFARLIRRERGGLRHVEGFFPEQRDRSSWVRLEEEKGLLILKTAGPHGEVEDQTEIPVSHAQALLAVCAGEVDYTRTALPIGEGHALVDEIVRPRVLHLVTVEFTSDAEASGFRPLEWFGPEVTADPRYTNQSIALRGLRCGCGDPAVRCGAQQPDRYPGRQLSRPGADGDQPAQGQAGPSDQGQGADRRSGYQG